MLRYNDITIERLNHAAIRLTRGERIYIDPFKVNTSEKGFLVLITHEHFDHCSIEDLRKVCDAGTEIVCPVDCQSKILGGHVQMKNVHLVTPGTTLSIGDVHIEAVPAYNTNKQFHPKDNDWVGYILTVGGARIYHSGDTDVIPEMDSFKDIDVACLPVSGTYVMTASEAVQAAQKINPKIAIPMHYGAVIGTKADAEEFKRLWKGRTEILGP